MSSLYRGVFINIYYDNKVVATLCPVCTGVTDRMSATADDAIGPVDNMFGKAESALVRVL